MSHFQTHPFNVGGWQPGRVCTHIYLEHLTISFFGVRAAHFELVRSTWWINVPCKAWRAIHLSGMIFFVGTSYPLVISHYGKWPSRNGGSTHWSHGDFPVRYVSHYQRVSGTYFFLFFPGISLGKCKTRKVSAMTLQWWTEGAIRSIWGIHFPYTFPIERGAGWSYEWSFPTNSYSSSLEIGL